jgi:hypothetical protein
MRFAIFEIFKALVSLHKNELYSTHPIVGAAMPKDIVLYSEKNVPKRPMPETLREISELIPWWDGPDPRLVRDFFRQASQISDYAHELRKYANGLWEYFRGMCQEYVPECIDEKILQYAYFDANKLMNCLSVLKEFAVFTMQHRMPVPGLLAPTFVYWTKYTEYLIGNARSFGLDFKGFMSFMEFYRLSMPFGFIPKDVDSTAPKAALLNLIEQWDWFVSQSKMKDLEPFRGKHLFEQLRVSVDALERHWQKNIMDEQSAFECAEMLKVVRGFIDAHMRGDLHTREWSYQEARDIKAARHVLKRELNQILQGDSLYRSLGVRRDATAEDIRRAYKKKSRLVHPDKLQQQGKDIAQATEEFQLLNRAKQILTNPETRDIYDRRGDETLDDTDLKRQYREFSVV